MKIALYSTGLEETQASDLFLLITQLKSIPVEELKIYIFEALATQFPSLLGDNIFSFSQPEDLDSDFELMVSLGGDGTILGSATYVRGLNIPILGINFGRLGFLATLSRDKIPYVVDALINGNFNTEERTLLHIDASAPLFDDAPFGLNDFAILKEDTSTMIKIHTYINGELLNTYWSDGLIVATPTGSTAYNLSCNGPIVFPDASAFVITPIAPHQLNVRSVVIPDNCVLSFSIESRSDKVICSLDSRRAIVDKNIKIAIKKESFKVKIVRLQDSTFLSTLRTKMSWGIDARN